MNEWHLLVIVKSHPLQTAKKALVRGEIIELRASPVPEGDNVCVAKWHKC